MPRRADRKAAMEKEAQENERRQNRTTMPVLEAPFGLVLQREREPGSGSTGSESAICCMLMLPTRRSIAWGAFVVLDDEHWNTQTHGYNLIMPYHGEPEFC